jgi:hypothetical protein
MSEVVKGLESDETNLLSAFLHDASEDNVAVMADDVPNENGSGIDYKLSYFEGQVGKTYNIKFITNPRGQVITHRNVYKKLPDPTRKGKTFQYVSSNTAKTCPVLELFFELHKLKTEGDPLATHKLKRFMGLTRQAVVLVQILSSDDATEVGCYRMMTISTGEKNSPIAELLNEKMNPSEKMIKAGFVKSDVFNIFSSPVMLLTVTEGDYDGNKGRDFSKSKWLPNPDSASVKFLLEDGVTEKTHKFSPADLVDGKFANDEAKTAFMELIKQLSIDALDIHNMFAFKIIGDPKNTEATDKYLADVIDKVNTIVPIIRNSTSMSEIQSTSVAEGENGAKPNSIKDNVPSELAGSVMSEQSAPTSTATAPTAPVNAEVNDILNS